jgi:hypothetical protein
MEFIFIHTLERLTIKHLSKGKEQFSWCANSNGFIGTENELKKTFETAKFVEKTCAQINKDLNGLSDVIISNRQLNDPLGDLIEQLIPIISVMKDLQQFIYKVDLPEKIYINAVSQLNWHELSYQIIRQEAQKVFLRDRFS